MALTDPYLRDLLNALRQMVADPEFWACLSPAVLLVLLFSTSVIRRSQPPPAALLALGVLVAEVVALFVRPKHVPAREVVLVGLAGGCVLWVLCAVIVVLAAVIQPGEPAPIDLGRAARHLLPAMVGTLLLGAYEVEYGWLGLPVVMVALGSVRRSRRVEDAWRTATVLAGCHAAVALGVLLPLDLFDRSVRPVLLFEGWVGAQVLMAGFELSRGAHGLARWGLPTGLLAFPGALGVLWSFPIERQLAWHALSRSLPRCDERMDLSFPDDSTVLSGNTLPASSPRPPILVADADEPLGPVLNQPLRVACLQSSQRRYGAVLIYNGPGVELLQVEGAVVLASGEVPSNSSLEKAARSCGLSESEEVAMGGGSPWPAQLVVDLCDRAHVCVGGETICTFSETEGWHIERRATGSGPEAR